MNIKEYLKYLFKEIIYSVVAIYYLVRLDILNKQLEQEDFLSPFELLRYENYKPIFYFFIAGALFLLDMLMIGHRIHKIRESYMGFEEIILNIVAILILANFLILILAFIDNPILRAIILASGIGLLEVASKN